MIRCGMTRFTSKRIKAYKQVTECDYLISFGKITECEL